MDYDIGLVKRRRIISPDECYFAVPGSLGQMSLVLTAASSQFLSLTWGTSPLDNRKATMAFWFKRLSDQAAFVNFYDGGPWNGAGSESSVRFQSGDNFETILYDGTSANSDQPSTSTYTDTTNWHHVCYACDTTNGTPSQAARVYIDGTEITYGTTINPGFGISMHLSDSGLTSNIGRNVTLASRYINAKLAYFYFIDGQQLTPSSFTTGTGVGSIHPISYGGTFGNNGYFLNFTGGNANDQSGVNSHNWTLNNGPTFSTDVPT